MSKLSLSQLLAFALILLIIIGAIVISKKGIKLQSQILVYFYKGNNILPVKREVAKDKYQLTVALEQLLAGPNSREKIAGIVTLLPENIEISIRSLKQGILEIILNPQIKNVQATAEIRGILKQIVFTATQFDNIAAVDFRIAGAEEKPLIIGGEGYTIDAPLGREYFD